jgi:sigma-B regulation protein RsbQ
MNIKQRNNIHIYGNGNQVILFAHGFGCDQNMWRFVAPAFYDHYKVILFDHVGSGNSDWSSYSATKYDSLDGYARDVLEICDELELADVIFVGHSVSCMIGILAAIREPEQFKRLVLIGPSPCYINNDNYIGGFTREDIMGLMESLDSNYLGWSSAIAPVIMGNSDRPELSEELANSFCRTNPEIAKQFAKVTFLSDNRDDLKKLKTPSLILQCMEDVIAPVEVGEYLHKTIPDNEMVILNASGHCPNLSAPKETIQAIKDFI